MYDVFLSQFELYELDSYVSIKNYTNNNITCQELLKCKKIYTYAVGGLILDQMFDLNSDNFKQLDSTNFMYVLNVTNHQILNCSNVDYFKCDEPVLVYMNNILISISNLESHFSTDDLRFTIWTMNNVIIEKTTIFQDKIFYIQNDQKLLVTNFTFKGNNFIETNAFDFG